MSENGEKEYLSKKIAASYASCGVMDFVIVQWLV